MSIIYKPLDTSIRTSQNDLYNKVICLERENAFITKLLNRYSDYLQQLCMAHEKTNKTLSLSCSDSFARLQKAAAYKDDDTGVHVSRIAHLSQLVAKSSGMSDEFCKLIYLASPMHDIGKIGIPDSILKKPGPLNDSEWEVMREHPNYGGDILSQSDDPMMEMAREIALCHHEKWDGTGYPSALQADQIPMSARYVAIVDVFDALTMDRCYRPALPDSVALSIIEDGRGKHFCPFVTDTFLAISDEIIQLRNSINDDSLKATPLLPF